MGKLIKLKFKKGTDPGVELKYLKSYLTEFLNDKENKQYYCTGCETEKKNNTIIITIVLAKDKNR